MEENCLEPGGVAGRKKGGTCQERPLRGWKAQICTLDRASPTQQHPFPVPLLLMGRAALEGTPRPRTSWRGGELSTHPSIHKDQTGPGFLHTRTVQSNAGTAIAAGIAITAGTLHQTPKNLPCPGTTFGSAPASAHLLHSAAAPLCSCTPGTPAARQTHTTATANSRNPKDPLQRKSLV